MAEPSPGDLARAAPPTPLDIGWQIVYRLAFPVAQRWWRLRRRQHAGALVAIYVGDALLLLRSSYRAAWNFPGGTIRPGETPERTVRRELVEEIGVVPDAPLHPVGTVSGLWDGRSDAVFIFEMRLDRLPALRLDNREIIGARLFATGDLSREKLTGPVRAYILGQARP